MQNAEVPRSMDEIVEQYASLVVRRRVPLRDVVNRFLTQYHAQRITDIPNLQMHRFNAFHLPANEEMQLSMEQIQIQAIRIPIGEETRKYTQKDYRPIVSGEMNGDDYIYLAYEEQLGYLCSNSNRLFLEAALARGISQAEIDGNTENWNDYRFYLKSYVELYL